MKAVNFSFRFLILLTAILFSAGCASITRGSKDTLVIESEPPNADVYLSNGMQGKTPATFKLPRKNDILVRVKKDGYKEVEVQVLSQISGAGGAGMAGNVILGGLIGGAIDLSTGAMNDLRPNPVIIKLEPEEITTEDRLERIRELFEKGSISEEEYKQHRSEVLKKV